MKNLIVNQECNSTKSNLIQKTSSSRNTKKPNVKQINNLPRSRQKHNFRSWLNRRKREMEARKWGHTDTARLIVCAPTWERGGSRQLPRSGITDHNPPIQLIPQLFTSRSKTTPKTYKKCMKCGFRPPAFIIIVD